MKLKSIILSRTDSLGDVILSLPLAGVIKKSNPKTKVIFLGKNYSKAIIETSDFVDEFINYDDISLKSIEDQIAFFKQINADAIIHIFPNKRIAKIAKKAKIPIRIGTSHRVFHLLTCNKRPNFSRINSDLHETQLNLKLLEPLGLNTNLNLEEIPELYGYNTYPVLSKNLSNLIEGDKYNIIFHPKSKGSAREWGLDNFGKLVELLSDDKYRIFVTGTTDEAKLMSEFLSKYKGKIIDLTGKMSLEELVSFISKADALVAASTGPLHIAAATGIKAIGIFAPMRPIHPGRWKPIGKKATYVVIDKENCKDCKSGGICTCILNIEASLIFKKIKEIEK